MARVLDEKRKCNTLDDADKREFDLDDRRIEIGTAGGKFHARLLSDFERRRQEKLRAWRDSNPQPSDPKSEALSG